MITTITNKLSPHKVIAIFVTIFFVLCIDYITLIYFLAEDLQLFIPFICFTSPTLFSSTMNHLFFLFSVPELNSFIYLFLLYITENIRYLSLCKALSDLFHSPFQSLDLAMLLQIEIFHFCIQVPHLTYPFIFTYLYPFHILAIVNSYVAIIIGTFKLIFLFSSGKIQK